MNRRRFLCSLAAVPLALRVPRHVLPSAGTVIVGTPEWITREAARTLASQFGMSIRYIQQWETEAGLTLPTMPTMVTTEWDDRVYLLTPWPQPQAPITESY